MSSVVSVAKPKLNQRRELLRSQRRLSILQSVWQILIVSSLAGGLIWVKTQPIWVLRSADQIYVSGNQRLSKQQISLLLTLSYPQSLLRIQPEVLARSLEAQPPVADATVTRQLFPPGLAVHVQERIPVAIASTNVSTTFSTSTTKNSVGLLDEAGVWIPMSSYASISGTPELPMLKVIGNTQQYLTYWPDLYRAISHAPVKVTEIDCQNPANLILKTELGVVHIGPYSNLLRRQLEALAQMRQFSNKINFAQINYIDLKNPQNPLLKMNQSEAQVKDNKP